MAFEPKHLGLYFSQAEIDTARSEREDIEHLQSAWQWLLAEAGDIVIERKPEKNSEASDEEDDTPEPEHVIKPELDALSLCVQDALKFRFAEDAPAGKRAAQQLMTGIGLQDAPTLSETIQSTLAVAHAFEMVRAGMADSDIAQWQSQFATFTNSLLDTNQVDQSYNDKLWLTALSVVSGVVLEDETRFTNGVAQFKQTIQADIHPEGYVKPAVQDAKESVPAFQRMVSAVAALTLTAEAATCAGEDLWAFEPRDVGVNTAATYLVYYYFYPDKWRWGDDDLTEDDTRAIFAEQGAWIEIATFRANPRGVELLLDERRPLFNAYMGGLTTLTHQKTKKRKKRGWFR
ncbi:MAG: alginate lyase family protein [Chloroflexota bacterium]